MSDKLLIRQNITSIDSQENNRETFEPSDQVKKRKHFTIINQEFIQNKSLSLEAKMVIIYLMSLPNDWVVNKNHLQKELGVGRDRLSKAMKELRDAGHIQRTTIRGKNGKIDRWHTKYSDRPEFLKYFHITENQYYGKSSTILKTHNVDLPVTGKQPLQNKQDTNKKDIQKKHNKEVVVANKKFESKINSNETKIEGAKKTHCGANSKTIPENTDRINILVKDLSQMGISQKTLSDWLEQFGVDRVEANHLYTEQQLREGKKIEDPGAYLATAIKKDFALSQQASKEFVSQKTLKNTNPELQKTEPNYPTHKQNLVWWTTLQNREKLGFLENALYKHPHFGTLMSIAGVTVTDPDFSSAQSGTWFNALMRLIGKLEP